MTRMDMLRHAAANGQPPKSGLLFADWAINPLGASFAEPTARKGPLMEEDRK
jgi:hypothetical protein